VRWHFADASLEPFADGMPAIEATSLVVIPIADHRAELYPEESDELGPMAEVRQHGFSSGRHAAHLAQIELGLDAQAVGRANRVPLWPPQCTGSITHTNRIAAAAASTSLKGIGIDLEEWGRVDDQLHRMLFTEDERATLESLPKEAATVSFSAKEAGYKAIYPTGQQFIGFKEAEIFLDWQARRFTIEYLGDHAPNKALNSGVGYWQVHSDHVLTVFVID
jgi:4'-phosphopantetheinyl transferase EntD